MPEPFPWQPVTRDDHLNLWIIELVFEYQENLRELVLQHLDRNVFLEEYDMSQGIRTIPYRQLLNVIENNLKMLVGTDKAPYMEFTRIWYGGLRDERFLDFTDVNRWFETMNLLIEMMRALRVRYYETNVFYLGGRPEHQTIGIG